MTLTPEDGTGLEAADAFVDLVFFKAFCKARGYELEYDTPVIEAAIREGFDWINTQARYKGQRLKGNQGGEFPRSGCTDWSGYEAEGVPMRVKNANCEVAYKRLSTGQSLFEDLSRGGQIISESVGPISTTYAQGAPTGMTWTAALNFLKPYISENDNATIRPGWSGTAGTTPSQFDMGMHDNNGSSGEEE